MCSCQNKIGSMKTNPKTNQKINNLLQKVGGATLGFLALNVAMEMGPQMLRDNELYVGAAAAAAGGYIAFKADSPLVEGIGLGVAAGGAQRVVKSIVKLTGMNVPGITGLNDVTMAGIDDAYMAGYNDALAQSRPSDIEEAEYEA